MKTYAEQRGLEPFDWNKELDFLIEQKEKGIVIEGAHYFTLTSKASDWVTCACGNQCDIIPRGKYGAPIDSLLQQLGVVFSHEVGREDFLSAKVTLASIENRSAELIRQHSEEINGFQITAIYADEAKDLPNTNPNV